MKEKLEEMEAELEEMKRGSIAASDTIFPGVNIIINGVKKTVEDELKHARLQMLDGQIVTGIF